MEPPDRKSFQESFAEGRGGEYADATLSEQEVMDAEYESDDPITG